MFPANSWTGFERALDPATFAARTAQMLKKLKLNFSGKILYDYSDTIAQSPDIVDLVDEFYASLWGANLTKEETSNLSVNMLKKKYISTINQWNDLSS